MNKKELFNIIKHKKLKIVVALLGVISLILLIPNAKFIMEIESQGNAKGKISYITPLYAEFDRGKSVQIDINGGGTKQLSVPINAKMVKKISINCLNPSEDFKITIKKAGIKFWYLPTVFFNLEYQESYKDRYENLIIILNKISKILIIIPIILTLIVLLSIIILFKEYLGYITEKIKKILLNKVPVLSILAIISLIMYIKYSVLKGKIISEGDALTHFFQLLKYESIFLAVMIVLLYLVFMIKNKYITYSVLITIFILICVYIFDISLIILFETRLDIFSKSNKELIPDTHTLSMLIQTILAKSYGLYAILLFVIIILLSIYTIKNNKNIQISKLNHIVIILLFILVSSFIFVNDFIRFFGNQNLYINVWSSNLKNTHNKTYSSNIIEQYNNNYNIAYKCEKGENQRKNVIVVFIESLSSYKSNLFSGLDDITPNLDKIAKENVYAKNFYSNGHTSQQGIFAFLTGNMPIINIEYANKQAYYKDAIPKHFKEQGYNTFLISGCDLLIGNHNLIAKNSEIEYLYDTAEHNVFKNEDRKYVFYGVEDKVLYEYIENWYKNQKNNNPFFLFVTTVSTHLPYTHPVTKKNSYSDVMKYADEEINNFIEKLKKVKYFDNGILVITGDHRAMLQTFPQEYDKLGPLAHAAIPLVIIGNGQNEIKGTYSHIDIGKSLEYLMLDNVCYNPFQRNIFKDNNQGCVMHQQSSNFSIIDVKCQEEFGQILLDGDNTRFINDKNLNISEKQKKEMIDYINYIRVVNN